MAVPPVGGTCRSAHGGVGRGPHDSAHPGPGRETAQGHAHGSGDNRCDGMQHTSAGGCLAFAGRTACPARGEAQNGRVRAGQRQVFTVGHGARPIGDFIGILRAASIDVLIDIRRFPGSRRHPHFGREPLAAALSVEAIAYRWQGDALGGRRSRRADSRHTALHNRAFAGYADHMDSPDFRSAVDALVERAATERQAIMCAETAWWHCHRMLVADALTLRGVQVVHLLAAGRWDIHRPHPTVRQGADRWPVYDVPDTIPGL